MIKKAVDQLNEAKKTVGEVDKLLAGKDDEAVKALKKQGKTMKDSAQKILDLIMGPEGKQGIYRDPFILSSQLYGMQSYLEPSLNPATQTQEIVMKQFKDQLEDVLTKVNAFFTDQWPEYQKKAEALSLSPFEEVETLKID